MAKGKGIDPIADAQEVAEHNINPHYWVNRVNSFTRARWAAEKKAVAPIAAPILLIGFLVLLWNAITTGAVIRQLPLFLIFGFVTSAYVAMAVQNFHEREQDGPVSEQIAAKRKKRLKRRKDWH